MPEVSIAAAATALGVSVDTIRRRIRRGQIRARQDDKGWWLVEVEEPADGPVPLRLPQAQVAGLQNTIDDVQAQLAAARDQLADAHAQRDRLAIELEAQRVIAAEKQRHLDDLRQERDRLWASLEQTQRLLAAPQEARTMPPSQDPGAGSSKEKRRGWSLWRRRNDA